MSFARPAWLWGLAASPAIGLVLWAAHRRAVLRMRRINARFEGGAAAARIVLAVATAAALALALSGPRWGFEETTVPVPETDVVLLLDTSGSMLARDVTPDRFSRVRTFARSLLHSLPASARVGLVRVEGEGEVLTPLTLDHKAVENALGEVVPRGAAVAGTDLGAGLRTAAALLSARESRGRAVVLFSDGEDLDSGLRGEAAACAERGIVVETVVAGTRAGGPVPSRDGGFQNDAKGRPVVSRADPGELEEIARGTGGAFGDVSRDSPAALAASLSRLERSSKSPLQRRPVDRSGWAFAAAAAAWTGGLWVSGREAR